MIVTYVINTYNHQAILFISGSDKILLTEGTTQGDPAPMVIYALGSLPLLDVVLTQNTKHAAYADDLSCVGKSQNLATRWHKTNKLRPGIAYFMKEIFMVCF